MWIVGLVALAQMLVLPGLVLTRALALRLNFIESLAFVFALSLMANAILVPVLVVAHLYIAPVLWLLIVLELWLLFKTRPAEPQPWTIDLRQLDRLRDLRFTTALGGLLLLTVAVIYIRLFIGNWGSVFTANDDVASWDRWAREWAASVWPTVASLYPQLMPANWSLTYVLLGTTEVKLFAKSTTVLYALFTTLLFLSLALRRNSPAPLFGGFVFGWLTIHWLGFTFMTYGYADLPLAFFAFLSFYAGWRNPTGAGRNDVLLALIFAFGAFLTKQGGIYVVVAAAVWAAWHWRRHRLGGSLFKRDAAVIALATVALFAVAWYGGKYVRILAGRDVSNLPALIHDLHAGRGYGERLLYIAEAFWAARGTSGQWPAAVIAGLLLSSLLLRQTRAIALFLLFPFLLLYGMFFSYEIRVAAPAFPLASLVCGFPLERIARLGSFLDRYRIAGCRSGVVSVLVLALSLAAWIYAQTTGFEEVPAGTPPAPDRWVSEALEWLSAATLGVAAPALVWILCVRIEAGSLVLRPLAVAACVLLLLGGSLLNPTDKILAAQRALARQIGDPVVNASLYAAVRERAISAAIVTDYWFLRDLPEIGRLFRAVDCRFPCTVEGLRTAVAAHPDAGYILIHESRVAPEARAVLLGSSEFSILFKVHNTYFLRVDPASPGVAANRPALVAVTPSSGSGREAVFRFAFTDPQGTAGIASVVALVNTRAQVAHGCYLDWMRKTNTLNLAADGGVGWAGEAVIGTPGMLRNSQCEVDASAARIVESEKQLELIFPVRFYPSFAGEKRLFGAGTDAVGPARQREAGTWTVP